MPPKKKGSSKKPPKVKTPILMDGLTKDEMSREQIVGYTARLQEELDRVREEKKSFKQERDQFPKFLGITERAQKEVEAELKNEQIGIEEDKKCHQEETQVIKQWMKLHLWQHQNTISELKAEALVSTMAAQEEQQLLESELHEKIWTIKQDMEQLNLDHESHIKELELKHNAEMTKSRERLKEQHQDATFKHKKEQEQLRRELGKRRTRTTNDIKEQWERHVANLRGDHKEAVDEIQKKVEDLCLEDPASSKQATADVYREAGAELEEKKKGLSCVLQDGLSPTECLLEINKEIAAIERRLKDKVKKNDTEMVRVKELADLEMKHEALEQKFKKLQLEREELCKAVPLRIQEVQQKADHGGEVLERKLTALTERWEHTQTQLDLVLSDPSMDQTALREVMNQVEEELDSSNNDITDLKHKIALTAKSRTDLL